MKYAFLNGALGTGLCVYGLDQSVFGLLLIWLGGCFLILAGAYARARPRVFGKRPDGTLPLWSWILYLPLHLYTGLVWHLLRVLSTEAPFGSVTDSLFVGRRVLKGELPTSVGTIVDLTAEFQEPAAIVEGRDYRSFPILDASVPHEKEMLDFIRGLPGHPIYIHCAQGHGRTGLFAAAVLLRRNVCTTVDEALALLRAARPRLRLNREQEQFLRQVFA